MPRITLTIDGDFAEAPPAPATAPRRPVPRAPIDDYRAPFRHVLPPLVEADDDAPIAAARPRPRVAPRRLGDGSAVPFAVNDGG
jgi:hypothetical protein